MARPSRKNPKYAVPSFVPGVSDQTLTALIPCDAYKLVHWAMYPPRTANLYFAYTARGKAGGMFADFAWDHDYAKAAINAVLDDFAEAAVALGKEPASGKLTAALTRKIASVFNDKVFAQAFAARLKDLGKHVAKAGRLPLVVEARKSAGRVPFGTPILTVAGDASIPARFAWLPGYFETAFLHSLWHYMTALTVARDYRALVDSYARETGTPESFAQVQCHDFSMRGMANLSAALAAGSAHLKYFSGSDTVVAGETATSAFASEHSVMCALGEKGEADTYARLLKAFPRGTLSLVSDTYSI